MKTKLLFTFLFFTLIGHSQNQIFRYVGSLYSEPSDGINSRSYATVNSQTPVNQTSAGANATWTFDQLEIIANSYYYNTAPTSAEIETYPNSNMVTTVTTHSTGGEVLSESKAYANQSNSSFSVTGATSTGLNLNYITNNCLIGNFPMSYGYSSTDAVGGTYEYGTYSGNFTGTITSTVDAYGSLTIETPLSSTETFAVTRLKTLQTASLSYSFFPNAGTATQTTYHYYREFDNFPLFKSTTTNISVPLLAIDQTETLLEVAPAVLLENENFRNQNSINIAPNPVTDRLLHSKFKIRKIESIDLIDLSGKKILSVSNPENTLDVSHLQNGIYFATVKTAKGNVLKKIVKNKSLLL